MASLTAAAALLHAAAAPVLFLDTCSILDVIRAPVRRLANCVADATRIAEFAASSPPRCTIVVGSFVPAEWHTHDQDVLRSLENHLAEMDESASDFHGLCAHLGIPVPFTRPGYIASGLAVRLHDLSRHLLQAATVLDRDPEAKDRAFERVTVTKLRPCRRGSELKDCQIFEECLEVGRLLRAAGFTRRLVFCSSNTSDYCDPGTIPHPDIAIDCAAIGMTFTTTLPWALSVLKS